MTRIHSDGPDGRPVPKALALRPPMPDPTVLRVDGRFAARHRFVGLRWPARARGW